MATTIFQTKNSLSMVLPIFLLLLSKAYSEEITSFSFTKFEPKQPNLRFQGDAVVNPEGKLQLTKVDENSIPKQDSLGRVLYTAPIHLWDKRTGNVASIVTSFSVVIKAQEKTTTAEGLAFFLAAPNTQPGKGGGLLGLFNSDGYNRSNQVVAVEFDTYSNDWDPKTRHIGIDVNNIKSVKTASWGLANGQVAEILITYNPSTKLLVASLIHPSRRTSYIVSEIVDLPNALPEWVRVGFTATTGFDDGYAETHDVLSWSFVSKLPDGSSDALVNDADLASHVLHGSV
ncbi:seed lectin subunit I-like [Abrus precatorius]|uniref:Seed lectin subunit I-like n=1 Tax=Abrus precatorius TaxID=3816 RepID=A0A8B8MAN8_ABRPR|nr:seed lectin subunit I-like [Abrus precatorius]